MVHGSPLLTLVKSIVSSGQVQKWRPMLFSVLFIFFVQNISGFRTQLSQVESHRLLQKP